MTVFEGRIFFYFLFASLTLKYTRALLFFFSAIYGQYYNIRDFPNFSYICVHHIFWKQVLLRLIGADETMYTGSSETLKWLEDTNVLDLIVDKFSSSVWSYFFVFCSKKLILCFYIIQFSPSVVLSAVACQRLRGSFGLKDQNDCPNLQNKVNLII
jgi:hypothetical protein